MPEFKETYPAAAFNEAGRHVGPGLWLDVIRKVNGLAHDEDRDTVFGSPTYADDDERHSVEIYTDATVSHDFPSPLGPPLPEDTWSLEYDKVARERERLRDVWVRDPRNTVTITSTTALGERLLTAAHDAVVGTTCTHCGRRIVLDNGVWVDPDATGDDAVWRETCDAHDTFVADHEPSAPLFEVVGVLTYDPETDTLS